MVHDFYLFWYQHYISAGFLSCSPNIALASVTEKTSIGKPLLGRRWSCARNTYTASNSASLKQLLQIRLLFPAQAHPCRNHSRKLKWIKKRKERILHVCAFDWVPVCVSTSVCMFMGVLAAAHGGWANLAWFSTVCCYSRLHIHWIGNECALRALQTTTMPRQSVRKTDRQANRKKTERQTWLLFYWEFWS